MGGRSLRTSSDMRRLFRDSEMRKKCLLSPVFFFSSPSLCSAYGGIFQFPVCIVETAVRCIY